MARPKTDPAATPTPARILTAAEAAFAERGFLAARLADVARAAGIRRPSLLYHFPTKERLYEAVVERAFARLRDALTEAMAGAGPFRARIEAIARAYLGFLADDPSFAPLMLREILDGRGPGRDLILAEVAPLLDALEAFVAAEGQGLRPGVSPRAAILQAATAALVRSASGPLRQPLWGDAPDATPELIRILLIEE